MSLRDVVLWPRYDNLSMCFLASFLTYGPWRGGQDVGGPIVRIARLILAPLLSFVVVLHDLLRRRTCCLSQLPVLPTLYPSP